MGRLDRSPARRRELAAQSRQAQLDHADGATTGRLVREGRPANRAVRELRAKFRSRCAGCDGWIEAGEPIFWHSRWRVAVHGGCAMPDRNPRAGTRR